MNFWEQTKCQCYQTHAERERMLEMGFDSISPVRNQFTMRSRLDRNVRATFFFWVSLFFHKLQLLQTLHVTCNVGSQSAIY